MENLTAIIPAYKSENTIIRTIDSLLLASLPARNIIVVEDGILDNTMDVVSRCYPEVSIIQLEQNIGGAAARNIGLSEVTTEYVIFLDADDSIEGEILREQTKSLASTEADLCFGRCKKRWPNGYECVSYEPIQETPVEVVKRWLIGNSGPGTCSVMWRSESLRSIGAWDDELMMNQDGELVIRALTSLLKLVHCYRGSGIYWQENESSVSRSRTNKALHTLVDSAEKIEKYVIGAGFFSMPQQKILLLRFWSKIKLRLITLNANDDVLSRIPKFSITNRLLVTLELLKTRELKGAIPWIIGFHNFFRLRKIRDE